jgi:hypothetical protein
MISLHGAAVNLSNCQETDKYPMQAEIGALRLSPEGCGGSFWAWEAPCSLRKNPSATVGLNYGNKVFHAPVPHFLVDAADGMILEVV